MALWSRSKKPWRKQKGRIREAYHRLRRCRTYRLRAARAGEPNLPFSFRQLALRANVASLVISFAVLASAIPYTLVSDCRANFNASYTVRYSIIAAFLFMFGFILGVIPSALASMISAYRDIRVFHNKKYDPSNLNRHIDNVLNGRLGNIYFGGFSFGIFLISTFLALEFTWKVYFWSSVRDFQTIATRRCAEAQGVELPDGPVNPWLPVTPVKPDVGVRTEQE